MELPDNPMSALRLMPNRVKEIAIFAKGIIESVRNGDANPLEVLVMLRSLELLSKEVIEQIEDNIVTAAEKYPGKDFEIYGARIEKAELGVKYHYDRTGDIEYERLKADAETANRRLKEREEFLRALKDPLITVNKETGEIYEILPPFKKSKSGVRVYIKS